jgi:hypothetical protein
MTGEHVTILVRNDRTGEAKLLNAVGDLSNLFLGMRTSV